MSGRPDEKKGEIFILEDDQNFCSVMSVILAGAGYGAVCFSDKAALLEVCQRRVPACIILDVKLQGRSGLAILDDLSDYPAPIVMMSGYGDIPMAVDAIKRGAVDFIQKPFTAREIVARLESVIGGASPPRETLEQKLLRLRYPGGESLSSRDREIILQTVSGLTSKEAALALGMSHRTVEEYRVRIMRKMGVRNATGLAFAILRA